MSIQKFCDRLVQAKYGKNDKKWFPQWIRRFATYANNINCTSASNNNDQLAVTVEHVVQFSKALLKQQVPAWQRLQAVRAVEAYRTLVLRSNHPCLQEIRNTLARIAQRERQLGTSSNVFQDTSYDQQLMGRIDTNEPIVIQR